MAAPLSGEVDGHRLPPPRRLRRHRCPSGPTDPSQLRFQRTGCRLWVQGTASSRVGVRGQTGATVRVRARDWVRLAAHLAAEPLATASAPPRLACPSRVARSARPTRQPQNRRRGGGGGDPGEVWPRCGADQGEVRARCGEIQSGLQGVSVVDERVDELQVFGRLAATSDLLAVHLADQLQLGQVLAHCPDTLGLGTVRPRG